jgi:hypothetical protein
VRLLYLLRTSNSFNTPSSPHQPSTTTISPLPQLATNQATSVHYLTNLATPPISPSLARTSRICICVCQTGTKLHYLPHASSYITTSTPHFPGSTCICITETHIYLSISPSISQSVSQSFPQVVFPGIISASLLPRRKLHCTPLICSLACLLACLKICLVLQQHCGVQRDFLPLLGYTYIHALIHAYIQGVQSKGT